MGIDIKSEYIYPVFFASDQVISPQDKNDPV
jgi:hypothetical protein